MGYIGRIKTLSMIFETNQEELMIYILMNANSRYNPEQVAKIVENKCESLRSNLKSNLESLIKMIETKLTEHDVYKIKSTLMDSLTEPEIGDLLEIMDRTSNDNKSGKKDIQTKGKFNKALAQDVIEEI